MSDSFFRTEQEEVDALKFSVQSNLQQSSPFLPNSFIGAILTGIGARTHNFSRELALAIKETWPDTASSSNIDRFGALVRTPRKTATASRGLVYITGTSGTNLGPGINLRSSSGAEFRTTSTAQIVDTSQAVVSLVRVGGVATVTLGQDHALASGASVEISGANETAYNGTHTVTILSQSSFSFPVNQNAATPASGVISASYTSALIGVAANEEGQKTNLGSGASLRFTSAISGLSTQAFVAFGGLTGGADDETDAAYQVRVLDAFASVGTGFVESRISRILRDIPGVTRSFILPANPEPGFVSILFLRDNDDTPIPDAAEIDSVRSALLPILPPETSSRSLLISAPSVASVSFNVAAISPNGQSMRDAITASLNQLVVDVDTLGATIQRETIVSAISNTIDPNNGQRLEQFDLISPVSDIVLDENQAPIFGGVIFT